MAHSFDLFDTLLGRLQVRPDSIFHLVEKNFPFPSFTFFRIAAEFQSDHTLPDIYRHFKRLTQITDEQSEALMQFELETELSQIFPIAENLNQVKSGDLIVSDTYYSRDQVIKILEKIGLTKEVHIYASPGGKSSGKIWDILKKHHTITSHLGDSLHSDVKMAKSHNIPSIHYQNSGFSSHEKSVMKLGNDQLAFLMRTLRLQNPYPPDSPESLFWNDQCQINVPVLIEASLYLHDFCQKHQKNRILFTSRDGCLWIQLFKILYPHYESLYFHASRYTYISPTPSYINYVKEIYTDDTVIVDSHGKGRSCAIFFNKHLKLNPTYLAIVNSSKKHHGILRKKELFESIEKFNYDTCGTLYDVQDGKPLRCQPEYDLQLIYPMHKCIELCAKLLTHFTFQQYNKKVMQWALKSMKANRNFNKHILHARFHCHIIEGNSLQHIHLP